MVKKVLLGLLAVIAVAVVGLLGYVQVSYNKVWDVPFPEGEASTDPEVIARGKYLVHGPAHCSNCHVGSLADMMRADKGENLPLAGGAEFEMPPLGRLYTRNLTPDKETGIGRYSDGQILRMMRHAIKPDGTASLALMMPFFNMAHEDHIAILSYLRSMAPVKNAVPQPEWTLMGKIIKTFAPPFKPILEPTPPASAPPMSPPSKERGEYLSKFVANCFACHTKHDPATFEQIGEDYAGGFEFEPTPGFGDPDVWTRSPNLTPAKTGSIKKFGTLEKWKERFRAGRAVPSSPMHWGPFSRMTDDDLESLWLHFNSLEPIETPAMEMVFKKPKS